MTHMEIIEFLESVAPLPIFIEPRALYDQAIVNFRSVMVNQSERVVAVYSTDLVIDILVTVEGMNRSEAVDWFFFNMNAAYMGPSTPIFIQETTDGHHSKPGSMGSH